MPVIQARHLVKVFGRGDAQVVALADASLDVDAGELVALMGPSGSGKTTLLRAISLIDPPTRGEVTIAGARVYADERSSATTGGSDASRWGSCSKPTT
jgi:putative ABC transport system ATP-binding protein